MFICIWVVMGQKVVAFKMKRSVCVHLRLGEPEKGSLFLGFQFFQLRICNADYCTVGIILHDWPQKSFFFLFKVCF